MAVIKTDDGWSKYREELVGLCSLQADEFISRVIADCNLEEKLRRIPDFRTDISYNFVNHKFFYPARCLNIFEDSGDIFKEGALQITVENADAVQERLMIRFEAIVGGQLDEWQMPTDELLFSGSVLDALVNASRRNLDISNWTEKFSDSDRIINFFETGGIIKRGYSFNMGAYNKFFNLSQVVVVPEHLCDVESKSSSLYRSWRSLVSNHQFVDCLLKIQPGVVTKPLLDMVEGEINRLVIKIMSNNASAYKLSPESYEHLLISKEHLKCLKRWQSEVLEPNYHK